MNVVTLSSLLTTLFFLYASSWPLLCCQRVNVSHVTSADHVTSVDRGNRVTGQRSATIDDVTTGQSNPADHVTSAETLVVVTEQNVRCSVATVDPFVHNVVTQLVKDHKASLIEYRLSFPNYTENPLTTSDVIDAYRAERWARITTAHGQTLLSLAFNYGVLSMNTLTLGTETLYVELVDSPPGCFGESSQSDKIAAVQYLLMRDFAANGALKTVDDARVCHEVILDDNGYAQFRHNCCYVNTINKQEECTTEIGNFYLDLLYAMLAIVRVGLLFFSPAFFIRQVEGMSKDNIPYVVKLKDKLVKTVWICSEEKSGNSPPGIKAERTLDLRTSIGFPKLQKKVLELTKANNLDKKLKVQFDQYNITVDYKRTLKENTVPVGLFQTLFRTFIKCRLRHTGPFNDCCKTNIFTSSCSDEKDETGVTWSKFCRQFSKFIVVLLVPFPFYIRLGLFYGFEEVELYARKEAIAARGLTERYDNSVVHYFTPSHVLFIAMYFIYAMAAVVIAFFDNKSDEKPRPKTIIVNSFKDLKQLNWTDVLSMAVSNFIWPLKRFGIYGCVVGLVYWPLVLVYTAVVCVGYLLPTLYLSVRMIHHAKTAIFVKERRSKREMYQVRNRIDKDMFKLEMDRCVVGRQDKGECMPYPQGRADMKAISDDVDHIKLPHYKPVVKPVVSSAKDGSKKQETVVIRDEKAVDSERVELTKQTHKDAENTGRRDDEGDDDDEERLSLKSEVIKYSRCDWRRSVANVLSAFLGIMTLFSCVIIVSEVIGCFVELATFTVMGVIVNASTLLRYVMLLLMIFVYCCDCFNNITKKYLKMNKALFNEVKGRINKDLEEETSRPSHLQQNRGFKAQELTQQASYELPDDIAESVPSHWIINDLVMFVDNEDMPRIPRKLFELVCNIRVAGVPGPVYRGHIEAVTSLIKIVLFVCFVFLIVLSFGAVYKVSSTNQTLAALLGGFLPMVLRTFLSPPAPDVEIGTVSFKSKMDEVIKNFCQYWPIYDLPFEMFTETKKTTDDKATSSGADKKDTCLKTEVQTTHGTENNNAHHPVLERTVTDVTDGGTVTMSTVAATTSAAVTAGTTESNKQHSPAVGTAPAHPSKPEQHVDDDKQQDDNTVDLLIHPPQDTFEGWLPEWSVNYDQDVSGV